MHRFGVQGAAFKVNRASFKSFVNVTFPEATNTKHGPL